MIRDAFELLSPLRQNPSASAIFTDFDGTMAPIVEDPSTAVAVPGVPDLLAALATHYRMVAVISGRPVSFLSPQIPPSVVVVGLYGLEVRREGRVHVDPSAERWRPVIADAAARCQSLAPPGVVVEPKGLSLTLHFRSVPAVEPQAQVVAEDIAASEGLVLRPARQSIELHPPVTADKGSALLALGDGLRGACYLGDDRGDLAAFDALDVLAAGGAQVAKIAVGSDEAPTQLIEAADIVVDGPAAAADLLRGLLP